MYPRQKCRCSPRRLPCIDEHENQILEDGRLVAALRWGEVRTAVLKTMNGDHDPFAVSAQRIFFSR